MIGTPAKNLLPPNSLWQHFPPAMAEPLPRVGKSATGNQGSFFYGVMHGGSPRRPDDCDQLPQLPDMFRGADAFLKAGAEQKVSDPFAVVL